MNRKGQFSIIAAMLVAVVLVASVVITYSSIRYNEGEYQPQILSSIDETDLGLKEILGFTVGYYGSVLKVTGNMTYAQQLATNYLKSGLNNMGDVQPEWGAVFNLQNLLLNANWFSTNSYSQGSLIVNYNLTGLGIYGVSYNASARLNVQIINASAANQAELIILRDDGEPLINLGKSNLQFYRYDYNSSNWGFVEPAAIASYANGTYVLDLPSGINNNAYVIQISDNRGLMVLASSFTQFKTKVAWNVSGFQQNLDYVDESNLRIGSESSFESQQVGPDGDYDTLTEAVSGTFNTDYYPSTVNLLGQTTIAAGNLSDLQSNNSAYLFLRSYATAYSSSYNTIGLDNQNSSASTTTVNSISWLHTTGIAGSDKILLVSVDVCRSSTPATVTGVTYEGTALTQLTTGLYDSSPRVRSYIYYLLNPTAGTQNITVSLSAANSYVIGGSITYTNINQTNPIQSNNIATGSGSSQSVSLTSSGANSKVLFGHLGAYRTSGYSISDGQTTRWSQTSQNYKGYGSDKTVTSGSVSTSWTTSNSASWVAIAALLQPTQIGTAFTCSAEFTGSSNSDIWNNLLWAIDASATNNGVNVTYQLYNYTSSSYTVSGDGYLLDNLTTSDNTKTQTITSNFVNYHNATGGWKLKVTALQTTTTPFDVKVDLIKYSPNENNYALNLEEQWLIVNSTNPRQDLCIKTGNFSDEGLIVQIMHNGSWTNLMTLSPNYFNNASLIPYVDSSSLIIRLVGTNDLTDNSSSTFNIDCVFLKDEPDVAYFISHQQSTFTIEILQNGTMRWLGQNLEVTTQTIPVLPVPVKALHVNQTINGVNSQVVFQIEDWASNYQIPLGLTSNTTVFGNRQMIVVLLDSGVSDFTVWWDGSDAANQTSMAYTNRFFTADNTAASKYSNGNITLVFSNGMVGATVAGTSTYSNVTFMRINAEASTYGSGTSLVIHHGIVRDIAMMEPEWGTSGSGGGAENCPNIYANIIILLPANATYYNYQLRIMFINSSQSRTISDLCPLSLTTSVTSPTLQAENGTLADFPIVVNGTATYANFTSHGYTDHHFMQFTTDTRKGAGIMFNDIQNLQLYAFDSFTSSTSKGAIKTSTSTLELLPVSSGQVAFRTTYDITWQGAIATFDGQTPICNLYDSTTPWGLWILSESPPTLTITAKS